MVCTFNEAPAVAYFRDAFRYYNTGVHPPLWFSPSNQFGTVDRAEVDFELLERLSAGLAPDGTSLLSNRGGHIATRQAGFDFTFSAPKSYSLRYAMADDEERKHLVLAMFESVRSALHLLQKVAGWARRGKGGERLEPVPLTAALFFHDDSRPSIHADGSEFGDPNGHIHAYLLNISMRADGTVGALQTVLLRSAKMLAGAAFHAALAANVAALGVSVDRIGRNGTWEVAGIGAPLLRFFSGRREELERRLERLGATSTQNAALAAKETASSRRKKTKTTLAERLGIWAAAAIRNGFDLLRERQACEVSHFPISQSEGEALYRERLTELLATLTANEAVLDHREVLRLLHVALVGTGLSPVRALQAQEDLLANGNIVVVGSDPKGFPVFSTPEMVRAELGVVTLAAELAASPTFALDPVSVRSACQQFGLSEEQTRAALQTTEKGQIAIVEGAPGTGKSTTLRPIQVSYANAGYKVIGTSTAWKIAKSLGEDLGIESRATQDWLFRIQRGESVLDAKTVLIVDEAGLLGARDMQTLLEAARSAQAKIVLVGDRNQIQPISAGSGLDLAARSVNVSRIETIVRQREDWLRQVVIDIGKGEALKALQTLLQRKSVRFERDAVAAVDAMVLRWRELVDRGQQPLLIARTNQQLRLISAAVRFNMRQHGELGDTEITFPGRLPNGSISDVVLAPGDRVRFLSKNKRLGTINGSVGEVTSVHLSLTALDTEISVICDGRPLTFKLSELADENGQVPLGWDYGWSGFGSQGTTVEEALVLADSNFDRHLTYVSTSRARGRTTLFVDSASVDALDIDLSKHGKLDQEAERLIKLSQRMAQKRKKASTLDYIPKDRWALWRAVKPSEVLAPQESPAAIGAPEYEL